MQIDIHGMDMPAAASDEPIYVGIQHGAEIVDVHPVSTDALTWTIDVEVRGAEGTRDFRGPHVHGRPGARFLYLAWCTRGASGGWAMFRRAKLFLADIDDHLLSEALRTGSGLSAYLRLSGPDGTPVCGGVHPPTVEWYGQSAVSDGRRGDPAGANAHN